MVKSIKYQLLVPANPDYLFHFYQDCYNWNVLFQGIERSWLESEPTPGVRGRVIFMRGGSWKLKVDTIHDDRVICLRAGRAGVRLRFTAEIVQVRDGLSRVTHTIDFRGISGTLIRLLWGRALRQWLQSNLYIVHGYAEKKNAEMALANERKRSKPRTRVAKKTRNKKKP